MTGGGLVLSIMLTRKVVTLLSLAAVCFALPLQETHKNADHAASKKSQLPLPMEDELELANLKQGKFGGENAAFGMKIPQAENMDNSMETVEDRAPVPPMQSLPLNNKVVATGEAIRESSLDMTPKAVAEYLLITADFQGFDAAVSDLLSSNVITQQEAQTYKDAVGAEYENLLRKLVDAEEAYLEEYLSLAAARRAMDPRTRRGGATVPKSQVPATGLDNKASDVNLALRRMQLRSLLEREATLDELLQVLVRDYLTTDMMTNPGKANLPANLPAMPAAGPTKAAPAMKKPLKPARVALGSTLPPATNKPQQVAA